MFDGIQRFRNILSCTDGNTMIKHMTNKSCEELLYIMDVFPKTVDSYIVERCVQLPSDYSTVDCPTVQQNFSRYLKYLPRDFPLQLPQETLCDPTCREVFQNGLDDGMKKTLVNKCFTKTNAPLTRETLAGMKSMITNLPLKSLKEISKEDLEANFDVIKQGIQSGESTKTTGKNMAVREIVKKLTQESGNLSMISDCNSCIQSLSVRDLKKTLKSNDTAGMLTSLGLDKHNVQFTDSQAKFLAKKVIAENITSLSADKFREMKSIVKGLVSQDMQKIAQENKNNSDGLEIATVFCEQTTWPSKTLHSIHGMIVDGLKYRNSSHPMKALTGVDVAGFGCECLINFSEDQLSSMDPPVCTDVCQKVGKCDNFVRINAAHRNNFFSGCMKCQNLKMENFTADTIEALGSNLLAQLTPAQVALMPSSAFQAMYDKLSGMCLSPEQGQAVTNKLATVAAPELTTDDMYKLSSAMYHLPAASQASLNKTVLKNMAKSLLTKLVPTDLDGMRARKECEQWLDDAGRAQLKEARFKFLLTLKNALMSSTARRKRSATSFWTCSNIQAFPDLFVMANVTEIEGITGNDFKDCILEIGSLNWNTEQKAALKAKMLSAYNVSSACNIEDISSIGTLAQTLTVTEINCLNLNNSILVTALGKQAGWSTNQSSALASNVLADRGLTNLSQNDTAFLASLGAIMCGFEPQVIKTMPPTIYLESDPQFSLYSDCTTSHLVALKEVVNDPLVYGAPGTWTAATTSELIYVIGGLTGPEIKNLSRDAIEGITTASIPFIPGNVLKELSMEQLSMLSDRQAVAVTAIQKLALSSEQVNKLTELATGASTVQPANATTAKPANATTVQPTNATTAKPANATTVQPANATTAKPANATTVQPANATTVQPANATTVQPANATTAKPAADTTTKPAETTTAKTGGASVGTQVAVSLFTTLLMLMASALILL
ncbi:uncharacterized protein LOC127866664 isoform X2 [Dreissena polymorpha]|uniref:uncharacterized protein LOC127866664 isoform X2 n=1 Tax=Dreissena polymorpha TaxID=45954 RepID=UPI0022649A71|nr:uncharacterized protein LOC127866664 isoform X2 [Dreissena polymorpha]